MVSIEQRVMPAPGDQVRVAWGLVSARGRVIDTYADARPRVVVEIDDEGTAEPVTVTVPLGAVEPLEESASPWAAVARFEREVAAAMQRVLGDRLTTVVFGKEFHQGEVDLVAELSDGRQLLVDVKRRPLSTRALTAELSRLRRLTEAVNEASAILVVPAGSSAGPTAPPRTAVVRWEDRQEDAQLASAIESLLQAKLG